VPWKASRPVDLKVEFVTRLKRGERMSDLCREYGIHRQTGYEVWQRYQRFGAEGLLPQSRAPKRIPHKTPQEIVDVIVEARKAHPSWGGKKLKDVIERERGIKLPSASTLTDLLKRAGLIESRRKRRRTVVSRPGGLREAAAPNEIWCADYKGEFRLGDRSYCYPFTMTDQFSRLIIACDGMAAIDSEAACEASANAFRKYGMPLAIRTDNGAPFASRGLGCLSRLSVQWLRLGIELEYIEPGHPEQNGRHERMHRTLKFETTRPAAANLLQQQERFDRFVEEFNRVRPHEALGLKRPADVYQPSARPFPTDLDDPDYPLHDDVMVVRPSGHIVFRRGEAYYLSAALVHQPVGILEQNDGRWLVTFLNIDLGYIDRKSRKFEADVKLPQKTSPMCPV
jgi:putative transposase